MHLVVFSESVLHVTNQLHPLDISFGAFFMCCTLSVSWAPVGPRTLQHINKVKGRSKVYQDFSLRQFDIAAATCVQKRILHTNGLQT